MRTVHAIIAGVAGLGLLGYGCAGGCGEGYSDGERAGVVLKVSKRGLLMKSWEGELNLGGVSQGEGGIVVPNVWRFSATGDAVAAKLLEASRDGRRVSVVYRQWMVKPLSQDTGYTVVGVK